MSVTTPQIVAFGVLEVAGLFFVVRLWLRPRRTGVVARVIWSLILLVPLFGLIIYGFLRNDPDEHPYDTDTMKETAESQAHAAGHGDD